ncbi:hypothetical protein B0H65DRAFT_272879 [Neurospora tetraspora]|uniref:non-specific serine/threonine protein kinase n=1 Tax=Neurospora tetraspora TaxID=94610 RepID=A0AAE0JBF5_9PEZI|nr:hypothetical protein B0H65DRAFT_272879 [Neurospora tetraspora]
MSRVANKTKVRKYGKPTTKSRAELLFAELPKTPVKQPCRRPASQILGPEPFQISEPVITESVPAYHEQKAKPSPEAEPESVPKPEPMSDEDDVHDVTEHFDSILLDEEDDHQDAPYASTPRPSIGSYTSYNTSVPPPPQQRQQQQPPPPSRTSLSSQPPRLSPFRKLASPSVQSPATLQPPTTNSPFGRSPFPLKSPRVRQLIQEESNQPQYQQQDEQKQEYSFYDTSSFHTLSWSDICGPPSALNSITKIAEASYAEVYRITNARGISIIKVIRLQSPIRPQTKAQIKSGLVDEEAHAESDLQGELKISEWLADIPGFVIYKERFIVEGKGTKELLETHQVFQRKMKRKDPGRAQFYPSPSRYLESTRFLVVELGDAGTALEDFMAQPEQKMTWTGEMLWDVFLSTAVAMARAEGEVRFEHRDLHEGNLCVRRVRGARQKEKKPSDEEEGRGDGGGAKFGWSGLEVTILDYGLSRATDPETIGPDLELCPASPIGRRTTTDREVKEEAVVFYDLERDPSMFTSTHAPQCDIYRRMRAYLLSNTPEGKPVSWAGYYPYTNVLWLSYIYSYLCQHFKGDKRELEAWREETEEMWKYLDPKQADAVRQEGSIGFGVAGDVVGFAVEKGWITEAQVMDVGDRSTVLFEESRLEVPPMEGIKSGGEKAITESVENQQAGERIESWDEDEEDDQIRRHSKRRRTRRRYVDEDE